MTPTTTPTSAAPETVVPVFQEHIVITPGTCGGKPRIAGHRIKVAHVAVWHERMGMSPAQIVAEYPQLTLGKVHAALAYYYDHKAELDADIAAGEEAARQLEASQPSLLQKIAAKRPNVQRLSAKAALGYLHSGFCPAEDIERLRADLPRRLAASPPDPDLEELRAELEAKG